MGPVRWGWLSQTSPIPRSPDGDKNMEVSTKYCDLGEETVFLAFEVAPVLLVSKHLAGKLVGGRHAEYLKYSSTTIAKCKHKYCDR